MINSRDIKELHPRVQAMCNELLRRSKDAGVELLVTSTYRDNESQDALYAQGRTTPGRIVTKAKAGRSFHNWRVAFDVVLLRNGKPVWGTTGVDLELWKKVGAIGKDVGLEWAGDWKTFKEYPHFQLTNGLTIDDLNTGKQLPV